MDEPRTAKISVDYIQNNNFNSVSIVKNINKQIRSNPLGVVFLVVKYLLVNIYLVFDKTTKIFEKTIRNVFSSKR